MNYQPYPYQDIETLLNEPWEITDQPYKLFAAYALSNLYDLAVGEESEEDEEPTQNRESIWGREVPKKQLDNMLLSIAEDFNDAAENYKPIYVWNKPYAVKKRNAYDPKRLVRIFQFDTQGENYVIQPEKVMDLAGSAPDAIKQYEVTSSQAKANRIYLRQIIALAEDDANEGWDKLSDLEVAIYCWALFYHRTETDNFVLFQEEYKEYLYLPIPELLGCLNEKSAFRGKPIGMYAFSAEKAEEWHLKKGIKSYAAAIPPETAENYWYDQAVEHNFKYSSKIL